MKILSAWRMPLLGFTRAVYYLVTFQDTDLPYDVPVRIKLSRGNEGVDAGLNPGVYEKLGAKELGSLLDFAPRILTVAPARL